MEGEPTNLERLRAMLLWVDTGADVTVPHLDASDEQMLAHLNGKQFLAIHVDRVRSIADELASLTYAVAAQQPEFLTVEEARQQKVCRICRGKDGPRRIGRELDAFQLHFGREYAHKSCLDAVGMPSDYRPKP
jgi:hypothetical protein